MARKYFNNVRHIIATTGTGAITLGTVPAGWQGFSAAGAIDGDNPPYELREGDNWEIGYLTLADSVTTATRTVLESSNGDAAIDLLGAAVLTCALLADTFTGDVPSFKLVQAATAADKAKLQKNASQATVAKAAGFTVGVDDRGVTFICTGTFTVAFTAAATLANGFECTFINISGVQTLDPDGDELIDGAATVALIAGESCKVVCDGSAFRTERGRGSVPYDRAVTISDGGTQARINIYAAPLDALAYNGMQINGGVDVSQELGTTGATLASGVAKYIADQWISQYVHGAGTAVVTSTQLPAASFPAVLPGYSNGLQIKATTAVTSPANGDYALHSQIIEGYRVARLGWGAAGAQPVGYAFHFYSTASGVAFVKTSNSDKSRCFYREFTVAAGWNFVSGTIDGDTSGTWQKTTSAGLILEIFSSGKAASPVSPGAWSATNTTQTTNSTNLLGTNNNLTILTGLFVIPGLELPTSTRLPLFVRPYSETLPLVERYFQTYGGTSGGHICGGTVTATTEFQGGLQLRHKMRATPAASLTVSGTAFIVRAASSSPSVSGSSIVVTRTPQSAVFEIATTGLTEGQSAEFRSGAGLGLIQFSARL